MYVCRAKCWYSAPVEKLGLRTRGWLHETGMNSDRDEVRSLQRHYMRPGRKSRVITWDRHEMRRQLKSFIYKVRFSMLPIGRWLFRYEPNHRKPILYVCLISFLWYHGVERNISKCMGWNQLWRYLGEYWNKLNFTCLICSWSLSWSLVAISSHFNRF